MSSNLFALLTGNAPNDAIFLTQSDGGSMTYAAMKARAAQIAHRLVGLGVTPGDRVAVQVEKSPEALLLYLACLRCGGVFLPLNTAYTRGEVDYFLNDAQPRLFVTAPSKGELTLGIAGDGSFMDGLDGLPAAFDDVAVAGGDLAAILYTSGTTGRSKGAMLSHANLWSNAIALREAWAITAQDRLIHALPIFHVHGLFVAVHTLMAAGASLYFMPKFDGPEIIRQCAQGTMLMGVPTFYSRLLAEPALTREAVSNMRVFFSGSAPLSAETHKEFEARTGHAIVERYGMTETGILTSNPIDGARIPGSVGPALATVDLRIAEPESGAPLAQGETGGIEVRGAGIFSGYWQMPEKTASEFREGGWFITGDLGRIDEAGYVHIAGRGRDLIISGGFNVYPAEVEALIDAIPGIAESAVIGAPHADFGEAVVAVVQASDPALDEAGVIAALAGQLARFKQPKRVIFLPELPRNTMGKVQKAGLRETYKGVFG